MKISVVIPTYNGRKTLPLLLDYLSQSNDLNIAEVVISDDGSDYRIEPLVDKGAYPFQIKLCTQPRHGERRALARNNGIKETTGDIVLFLDDDCIPTPNLISDHILRHQENGPNLFVVGARHRVTDVAGLARHLHDNLAATPDDHRFLEGHTNHTQHPPWYSAYSCHISVSRKIAELGFDDDFVGWGLEDQEFALRASEKGANFLFMRRPYAIHVDSTIMSDPFHTDKTGGHGNYSPFVLNTARFFAKHNGKNEVDELLLRGLKGLVFIEGQWTRDRNQATNPFIALLWGLYEISESEIYNDLSEKLFERKIQFSDILDI